MSEKAGSQTEAFKSQVWVISRGNKAANTESSSWNNVTEVRVLCTDNVT